MSIERQRYADGGATDTLIMFAYATALLVMLGAISAAAQQTPQKVAVPAGVLDALNAGGAEYKAEDLQAYAVDLNGDRTPEIVVIGKRQSQLCSGSGNCGFWLFARHAEGYQQLFRLKHDDWPYDRDAADWKVLDTVHEGYRDLQLEYRDTQITATATTYQMRDGRYEYAPGSCASLTYGYFDDGKFHAYDPPKSERCGSEKPAN